MKNDEVSKHYAAKDIHSEVKRNVQKPERHKSQGKKIKRSLFWKNGKRPTDKAPKNFLKMTVSKNEAADAVHSKLLGF